MNKSIALWFSLTCLGVFAVACPGPKNENLTVTLAGAGTGTVSSSGSTAVSCSTGSCNFQIASGTALTLVATPGVGSVFSGWSGGCTGTGNCSLTVTAATTVTATFGKAPTYPFNVTMGTGATGTGTVTSNVGGINCGSGGSACSSNFIAGTTVTLTATADATSAFSGWGGDAASCGTNLTCTLVTGAVATNVSANFDLVFNLTVTVAGTGTTGSVTVSPAPSTGGTCSNATSPCTFPYWVNTSVTLTAATGAGATFSGWGGACSSAGTATTCTVTMSAAQSVTATFATIPETLTVTASAGGTVTSADTLINCTSAGGAGCSATYNYGSSVVLTATPAADYVFSGWTGGGCTGTGTCTVPMTAARSVSATFTYVPFTVSSTTPANGATAVTLGSTIAVTFNRAANVTTVTFDTTTTCTGSFQVSSNGFATCIVMSGGTANGTRTTFTFTPSVALAASTTYKIRVLTSVKDAAGNPLVAYTSTTGFTTGVQPEVSMGAPRVTLQGVTLNWTNPTDPTLTSCKVSYAYAGTGTWTTFATVSPCTSAAVESLNVTPLYPYVAYDFAVQTINTAGATSTGVVLGNQLTAFTGTAADWLSGATGNQTITGVAFNAGSGLPTHNYRFTWSNSELVAAFSNYSDTGTPLAAGDALFIAFDTDPAGSDTVGEYATYTTAAADPIVWPFLANYVLELQANGTVFLKAAGGPWNALTTDVSVSGVLAEVGVLKSSLGNPAQLRIAFADVNTAGGTYDVAPYNTSATDAFGLLSSLTGSENPGTNVWGTSWATSAAATVSPISQAAGLVTLAVSGAPGQAQFKGSLPPLSSTLSNSTYYPFYNAGTATTTGIFNFGGGQMSRQPLLFKPTVGGTPEPLFTTAGLDHIYTLAGTTETIPTLTWNTVYSATHTAQIQFVVNNAGTAATPTNVAGNYPELGASAVGGTWSPTAGAPLFPTALATQFTTALVNFTNRNFVTGTILNFAAYYSSTTSYEATSHTLDDDIINYYVAQWTTGSNTVFQPVMSSKIGSAPPAPKQ